MEYPKSKSASRGRFALYLILSAAALGIFLAPWYVPVSEPSTAQSYTYGFNNSIAILAIGLALAALFVHTLWRWRDIRDGAVQGAIKEMLCLRPDPNGERKLLASYFVATIISSALIAVVYWYSPFGRWGEMNYFLSRIYLLILNRVPYYDFPLTYGPGMIYPPFYLYRVAHGLLSVEQAYCIILILHWIIGLYVFVYCVRALFPPSRRLGVFWVFAAMFINPGLGVNYTPLRFVLPIAALLFCHDAVTNSSPDRFRGHLRVALAAFFGALLNFEFSPEMGLGVTVALGVYFAALLRTPRRGFAHGALFGLLGAMLAVLPWSNAYLNVLFSYGGAASLPVFPGPDILLFLAMVFFLLPRLAAAGVTSKEENGPASLALCVLSGILLIPAFSRCDGGHVFLNGLAIILLSLAALARLPDYRWFRAALSALFFIFTILGSWIFLFHYSANFRAAMEARSQMRLHGVLASQPVSHGFYFSKKYPPLEGLDPLLAYGPLGAPLGCSEDIEHFLLLNGRYQTGFYPGNCSDVFTLKQAIRQEGDLKSLQMILVPKIYLSPLESPDPRLAMDYRFLRNQFLLPIRLVVHHPLFSPERLVAAKITQEYSVIGEFREYLIMARRAGKND